MSGLFWIQTHSVGMCHHHMTYLCTLSQAVHWNSLLCHFDKAYSQINGIFLPLFLVLVTNPSASVSTLLSGITLHVILESADTSPFERNLSKRSCSFQISRVKVICRRTANHFHSGDLQRA